MRLKRGQMGQLLEVPVIATATGMLLAFLLPRMDGLGGKIVAAAGTMVLLWVAHYMTLGPGWQAGAEPRARALAIVLFVIAALLILSFLGFYLFGNE